VLEGAEATMFTVSLLSNKVAPKVLVEPFSVCVAVNVLVAEVDGIPALDKDDAPVPPEVTGRTVVSVVVPVTLRFPVFVSPGVVMPVVPSIITVIFYSVWDHVWRDDLTIKVTVCMDTESHCVVF
jgi:hypothetical protein